MSGLTGLPFWKMHGLGNDFVVLDGRPAAQAAVRALRDDEARAISDRRTGVGCDQLIVIEPAKSPKAAAFMRIRNADGGEVEACGNAARCVANLLMRERGVDALTIETVVGLLETKALPDGRVAVDMGPARDGWAEIPVARSADTLRLPVSDGPLVEPVGVNVGNPHAVFFVPDAEAIDLATLGPRLERHPFFPQRTNVEAVSVLDPGGTGRRARLRMRVWERGVGITRACGTGACAAAVAASRRGLTGRAVDVVLDGGTLSIDWLPNGHVLMAGPTALAFVGQLDTLAAAAPAAAAA
ncbi:MAG: diaminopimelate epimerase [Alphaproteobacteria bacterium]|nr:diaminopimelate epimerase [Alphaproteobacteria bacterium]